MMRIKVSKIREVVWSKLKCWTKKDHPLTLIFTDYLPCEVACEAAREAVDFSAQSAQSAQSQRTQRDSILRNLFLINVSPLQTFGIARFKITANIWTVQMVLAHPRIKVQPNAGTVKGVQRIAIVGTLILRDVRQPILLQIFGQLMPVRFSGVTGQ